MIGISCSTEKGMTSNDLTGSNWPYHLAGYTLWKVFAVSTRLKNEQSFNNLYLCGGSCSRRKWHMGSSVFFSTCQHLKSCDREREREAPFQGLWEPEVVCSNVIMNDPSDWLKRCWQDVPRCTLIQIDYIPWYGLGIDKLSFYWIDRKRRKRRPDWFIDFLDFSFFFRPRDKTRFEIEKSNSESVCLYRLKKWDLLIILLSHIVVLRSISISGAYIYIAQMNGPNVELIDGI